MLDDLKFINQKDPHDQLGVIERGWRNKSKQLAQAAKDWRADNPTQKNLAKQIAEYMAGKTVVVYCSDADLARTWKSNIALRARNRAFNITVKAENPVEIAAWSSHPVDKLFAVILLRKPNESSEITKAYEQMKRKLSGQWPHPLEVDLMDAGDWAVYLGELSSAYLAILNGITLKKDL